jgi:site-specific DNA-cytosine methylase
VGKRASPCPAESSASTSWLDVPSCASSENRARMKWLMENDAYDLPNRLRPPCHQGDPSYVSMYGRLKWGEPAQTIASGFGSLGQGWFMHPSIPRTLTPHEAARLQGFPDYFTFDFGCQSNTAGDYHRQRGSAASGAHARWSAHRDGSSSEGRGSPLIRTGVGARKRN